MNTPPHPIRLVFWLLLGGALSLTNLALAPPLPMAQSGAVTPAVSMLASDKQPPNDVGSTDGIVLMAVIIVLIVLTPILLRRKDWKNGKQQK